MKNADALKETPAAAMSFEVRKFRMASGQGATRWTAPYAVYCFDMDCYMFHGSQAECEAWIANGADGWAK